MQLASTRLGDLVAVQLKYSPGAEPLRIIALSQIAIKALYKLGSGDVAVIAGEMARISGSPGIAHKEIKQALRHADSNGVVKKEGSKYRLTDSGKETLTTEIANSKARTAAILEHHFPSDIESQVLEEWFVDASSLVFEQYANYWARSICRLPTNDRPPADGIERIVMECCQRHHLESHSADLLKAFDGFLTSVEPRDHEHIWVLGQSMFAARLISASIGADPITSKELKDAWWILDTNAVVAEQLKVGAAGQAINALNKPVGELGALPMVFSQTKEEYRTLVGHKKDEVIRVVSHFPLATVQKSGDSFVHAAIENGCTQVGEFEAFFDKLMEFPNQFGGTDIAECEEDTVLVAAIEGTKDKDLKSDISEIFSRLRPYKKMLLRLNMTRP